MSAMPRDVRYGIPRAPKPAIQLFHPIFGRPLIVGKDTFAVIIPPATEPELARYIGITGEAVSVRFPWRKPERNGVEAWGVIHYTCIKDWQEYVR